MESLGLEVAKVRDPVKDQIQMLSQLLEGKQAVWMEGSQGWTTWMEVVQEQTLLNELSFCCNGVSRSAAVLLRDCM
ncbi:hypothetical protein SUGI_0567220 [Cryptomeria japonica]|nr:hypothetical protein SUGI_0567220 [Cryptomeria japonica]